MNVANRLNEIHQLENGAREFRKHEVRLLADFDAEFHEAGELNDLATSLALGAEALLPERILQARSVIEQAARLAMLLPRVLAPAEESGVTILWDEALARLGWLIRHCGKVTAVVEPMAASLLERYAAAGLDAGAVAQRLATSYARCQTDSSADLEAPHWRSLCRFVVRPDVVGTIRALERLTLAEASDEFAPQTAWPRQQEQQPDAPSILGREKFAEQLGISVSSVDRLIAAGLPHFRPGQGKAAAIRIRWEPAIKWLEEQQRSRASKSVRLPRRDVRR